MTVNVSTRELVDPAFLSLFGEALAAAELAPDQLVLDITEDALHDSAPVSLRELKSLGVRLFLDDFATAEAVVSSLTRFPLDGCQHRPQVRLTVDRPRVEHARGRHRRPAVDGLDRRACRHVQAHVARG